MTGNEIKTESELIYNKLQKDKFRIRDLMKINETELKGHTDNKALALSNALMLYMKSSFWTPALLLLFTVFALAVNSALVFAFGIFAASGVGRIKNESLQDVFALFSFLILIPYEIIF